MVAASSSIYIVIFVLYYFTVKCDYQISFNCGISILKSPRTLWGRSLRLMSDSTFCKKLLEINNKNRKIVFSFLSQGI